LSINETVRKISSCAPQRAEKLPPQRRRVKGETLVRVQG